MTVRNATAADRLPVVLVVRAATLDAGAIDTHVYCVNVTAAPVRVTVESTSFTTIDDEGALLHHGSAARQTVLAPGQSTEIADVAAWEWDGHVGLLVTFADAATGGGCRAFYNLKHGAGSNAHAAPLGTQAVFIAELQRATPLVTDP